MSNHEEYDEDFDRDYDEGSYEEDVDETMEKELWCGACIEAFVALIKKDDTTGKVAAKEAAEVADIILGEFKERFD